MDAFSPSALLLPCSIPSLPIRSRGALACARPRWEKGFHAAWVRAGMHGSRAYNASMASHSAGNPYPEALEGAAWNGSRAGEVWGYTRQISAKTRCVCAMMLGRVLGDNDNRSRSFFQQYGRGLRRAIPSYIHGEVASGSPPPVSSLDTLPSPLFAQLYRSRRRSQTCPKFEISGC
ncbi:hypothetical protein K431DRAFT_116850 [Polychaeton citri CBS 116435]|uniref:Uncharacterized protein n=1 Tax=Polychaeton citri CBS 116435 TaxID=1314669 RepID=A0A9P4QEY7_9PEZI|nr:hypothetical protein K431DRAFT_116850 [Polychaeton citri CBS 116435]